MNEEQSAVQVHVDEHGVAELALNRPDRGNAMGRELLEAFTAAVARLRDDATVKAIVVMGRGKNFCTGADLREWQSTFGEATAAGEVVLQRTIRALYEPFLSVLDLEVPLVAAVRGAAIGGGLGLALACDLRIAAVDARLHANFVRLGISPGMGVSWSLPRLVGPERAAEILLTGRAVSGQEAEAIGLVVRAVPAESVESEAHALARSIAEGPPRAVRAIKEALRRGARDEVSACADREALAQARCMLGRS